MVKARQLQQEQHLFEKPFFQYFIVFSIIATFVMSSISLYGVYQLRKALIQEAPDTNDFLKRLTSHEQMKTFAGIAPLNIIEINGNNLASLQSQIIGLDITHLGSFIVQYTDKIVLYDYDNNRILGTLAFQQPQGQLPLDFFDKLNKHPEAEGLQDQQPIGGQLDEASLNTLRQQFPDAYANAKVRDYLLRYQTKLIIYDYNADRIVNSVNLQ